MKVLAPLTIQPPSTRSARVRMEATSEPASGSVIASAAIFSPRTAGASQRSRCASVPNDASGGGGGPQWAPPPAPGPPPPPPARPPGGPAAGAPAGGEPARAAARDLLGEPGVGDPVGVLAVLEPQPPALRELAEHRVREAARRLPLRRARAQLALDERAHLRAQRLVPLGERRDGP